MKFIQNKLLPALMAASLLGQSKGEEQEKTTVLDIINTNDELIVIVDFLVKLEEFSMGLTGANNITFLAPSNIALEKLLDGPNAYLANDTEYMTRVFNYHLLDGYYNSSTLFNNETGIFPSNLTNDPLYANLDGVHQVVKTGYPKGKAYFYSGLNDWSSVAKADLKFDGGIVHIIDSLLTLPRNVSTTASRLNLTGFTGALKIANLTTAVDSIPKTTVFAPSNEAFAAAGNNTANLKDVLSYHVVNGTVAFSNGFTNGTELNTLDGKTLTIHIKDKEIYVNGAKVIQSDIITSTGVLHVIDSVLNPTKSNETKGTGSNSTDNTPSKTGQTGSASVATFSATIAILVGVLVAAWV